MYLRHKLKKKSTTIQEFDNEKDETACVGVHKLQMLKLTRMRHGHAAYFTKTRYKRDLEKAILIATIS